MRSRMDRRLRQARPAELDQVPGGDRQERDLQAAFGQPAARSAPTSPWKTRRGVLVLAAAGTAAAVAATFGGIAMTQPDPVTAQPGTDVSTTQRAAVAREVLFAAAELAGRESDITRRPHTYWHRTGWWLSAGSGKTSTLRDEQWVSIHDDGPTYLIQDPANGEKTAKLFPPGSKPFMLGSVHETVSTRELLALPTEPGELRTLLLARRNPAKEVVPPAPRNLWLFTKSAMVVNSLPVRTATRAAGFKIMADIPGVRVDQDAKDAIGRRGTAVTIDHEDDRMGTVEYRLVFDPRTSAGLSYELRLLKPGPATANLQPGTVLKGTVTKSIEWTSRKPPKDVGRILPTPTGKPQG